MRQFVWVFLAGGAGASLRMALAPLVDSWLAHRLPFVGTLIVNLIGCFAIGLAAATMPAGPWRPTVIGGLLGGFTTYSAFALFSVELVRGGKIGALGAQILLHVVGGMLAAWAGLWVGRLLVPKGPG